MYLSDCQRNDCISYKICHGYPSPLLIKSLNQKLKAIALQTMHCNYLYNACDSDFIDIVCSLKNTARQRHKTPLHACMTLCPKVEYIFPTDTNLLPEEIPPFSQLVEQL